MDTLRFTRTTDRTVAVFKKSLSRQFFVSLVDVGHKYCMAMGGGRVSEGERSSARSHGMWPNVALLPWLTSLDMEVRRAVGASEATQTTEYLPQSGRRTDSSLCPVSEKMDYQVSKVGNGQERRTIRRKSFISPPRGALLFPGERQIRAES
ncbi:hypothetical protein OJAV_G00062040 [Oryzias javanicus]|uniref:Uncharacterized protein n=1 Tax=Oryzias javanicus TaxID=123683 RepID=A0A437D661_ORYJA|nr:hypothetical protein OJAV_G00062040 [Oryzias javanicus]